MKRLFFAISAMSILGLLAVDINTVSGQEYECDSCNSSSRYGRHGGHGLNRGSGSSGVTAARLHQHNPDPIYAYGPWGYAASRTERWNLRQMQAHPWHGNYSYWRFGTPTALVVPPTANFQTTYNWGVGQTTSTPIYHQFGDGGAGLIEGGAGGFPPAPYWPSSTNQLGVYPVRAPWGH